MKKFILYVVVLSLLLAGCAQASSSETDIDASASAQGESAASGIAGDEAGKKNETVEVRYEKEKTAVPSRDETFESFSAIKERLNLQDHVVFRGIKTRALESYATSEAIYFPIELRVIEPLYGNIQPEELILFREIIGTHREGGDVVITAEEPRLENIAEGKEYIFILERNEEGEAVYYDYVSLAHSYSMLEDAEALAAKVQAGKATSIEQFRSSVLAAYQAKDFRLDLQEEARKFISGIEEPISSEELLAVLPAEQKALFEKLADQYGVK